VLDRIAGHNLNRTLPLDIQARHSNAASGRTCILAFGMTQSSVTLQKPSTSHRRPRCGACVCNDPVAVAIPCHRVVAEDEKRRLRWASERKRTLLQLEQQGAEARSHTSAGG